MDQVKPFKKGGSFVGTLTQLGEKFGLDNLTVDFESGKEGDQQVLLQARKQLHDRFAIRYDQKSADQGRWVVRVEMKRNVSLESDTLGGISASWQTQY